MDYLSVSALKQHLKAKSFLLLSCRFAIRRLYKHVNKCTRAKTTRTRCSHRRFNLLCEAAGKLEVRRSPGDRNLTLQSRHGLTQLHLNAVHIIIWNCCQTVNDRRGWLKNGADKSISDEPFALLCTHTVSI